MLLFSLPRIALWRSSTTSTSSRRAGEVLVRVLHSGICHSDLTVIDAGHGMPVVLGHEAAGEIADVGAGSNIFGSATRWFSPARTLRGMRCVRSSCGHGVRSGSRLCSPPSSGRDIAVQPGRQSRAPRTRRRRLCRIHRGSGKWRRQGSRRHATRHRVVIGCAVQTGVGAALNTAEVRAGSSVLVLGAGGVGQAVVQGARMRRSARDRLRTGRRTACACTRHGGNGCGRSRQDRPSRGRHGSHRRCRRRLCVRGGRLGRLVQTGIELTGVGGTIVMVGAPPIEDAVTIDAAVIFMTMGKRILSSLLGGCWPGATSHDSSATGGRTTGSGRPGHPPT